jgi:acyl transferase domain-containing protein
VRFGPFLTGIDGFDAKALGVTEPEAILMDPQQRLLLELVGELLLVSNSRHPSGVAAAKQETGVYVGVSSTDYAKVRSRMVPVHF